MLSKGDRSSAVASESGCLEKAVDENGSSPDNICLYHLTYLYAWNRALKALD
jgi:hypothetical protein